jgi:transcriptional regulator with XRE-family HTH domain
MDKMMDKMSLRALRVNKKYTQKVASEKIGVSQKTLSNWEKGITFPDQKQIEKICIVYDTSYDYINFMV